jgi:hypothetical protein
VAIGDAILDFFTENKKDFLTKGVIDEKKRFSWQTMTDEVLKFYTKL